ncbi:response regulator [Flavobacterium zepuense]|uniref:Response regulator n=1 Tax=Flavobacterium zepuense TaxID=2593302 RepID=A0A552V8J1_9FLAO|nr:response regulator [Flavobacterium zepuense]TRW26759.1 response regulator [Flavobacterium zepuense]
MANRLHVVLADDDDDDRMIFEDAFNQVRIGHTLDMVDDGYALMQYLENATEFPDIIFLDLNMPGKSGKECLKEIRADPKFREVAVAIYSTSASATDLEDTFIAGANIYVKKPSDFLELKKILAHILSISKLYVTDGLNRNNFMMSFLEGPKVRTPKSAIVLPLDIPPDVRLN